jgi:hypothetical protein
MVVLPVCPEVLGEALDPLREQRDLNLRGARVGLLAAVPADDPLLDVLCESHCSEFLGYQT